MTVRVGTLCYATDQGLGIIAKGFHDHGVVTDALVIGHSSRPTHREWHLGSTVIPHQQLMDHLDKLKDFCRSMDVMLFFETPFWWPLTDFCREHGVKTALVPNHECMPSRLPAVPDLMVCPSLLELECHSTWKRGCLEEPGRVYPWDGNTLATHLPIPVSVPWRPRTKAEVFVHNAGHGGLRGRNGTIQLIEAMRHVKSPIRLILRNQDKQTPFPPLDHRIDYRGHEEHGRLFDEGDVFVFPEKFCGQSCPLEEARAAGMLVMGTGHFPANAWLPHEPLIPVEGYLRSRLWSSSREFDEAVVSPRAIAERIDEWFGRDITEYSLSGRRWAEEHSWEVLGPRWTKLLADLVENKS